MAEEHHHEHGAHHEAHHEAHHAAPAPKSGTNSVVLFVVVALIAGIIIGFAFSALSAPKTVNQGNFSATATVSAFAQNKISSDAASAKALSYLNDNFLSPRGMSAALNNVSEKGGLYVVSFNIMQGNETLQPAEAYVSFDGGNLIIGNTFDLNTKPPVATATPTAAPATIPKADKADVKLFVMSFCPYGSQAQQIMYPVAKALGAAVKIEPRFVVYADYCAGGRCNTADYCIANGTLCSMHGISEVNEDARQLCIWKYQESKWLEYNNYVNTKCSLQNIETCWKDAAKATGVNEANVTACFGKEAETLLKADQDLNAMFGVQGSPALVINGVQFEGERSSTGFKDAICNAFNTAPSQCSAEVNSSAAAAPTGGCA